MASRIRKPGSPITKEFLEELAVKDDSGCWLWPRATTKAGYGVLRIGKGNGKMYYVHRLAWELWNGKIPKFMHALHRCDVPRCFNPAHIFLGTHQDNMKDALNKGRVRHGENHASALLTIENVLDIRRRSKEGENQHDLAKAFGICRQAIYNVTKRRTWKHVP